MDVSMKFSLMEAKHCIAELYCLSYERRIGFTRVLSYYIMYMFSLIDPCTSILNVLRK